MDRDCYKVINLEKLAVNDQIDRIFMFMKTMDRRVCLPWAAHYSRSQWDHSTGLQVLDERLMTFAGTGNVKTMPVTSIQFSIEIMFKWG